MMVRAATFGLLALVTSACSLMFGIDRDEYTRGEVKDGDGGASDGTTVDAADVSTSEGAVEGGPDVDGSGGSPCGSAHRVCDDFDAPTTLSERGWDPPYTTGGSTLVVDSADSTSAPSSLAIVTAPDQSSVIGRPLAGLTPNGKLTFAFDLKIESAGPGVAIADLGIGPYRSRVFVRGDGTITVDEWDNDTGRVSNLRVTTAQVLGRWAHVELVTTFVPNQASGSRIALFVDGTSVTDTAATPTVATGGVNITLGAIDHPSGQIRARFDNVTFD